MPEFGVDVQFLPPLLLASASCSTSLSDLHQSTACLFGGSQVKMQLLLQSLVSPQDTLIPPSVPSTYLGLSAALWSLYAPGLEGNLWLL